MTAQQQAWLAKAQRSLSAARVMLDSNAPDIAASRAYYSMFYVAQALLEIDGLKFSSHSAVIGAFGKHFAATDRLPRHLHRYLLDAFDARNQGDYDITEEVTPDLARMQIQHAEEFVRIGVEVLTGQQSLELDGNAT